MSEDKLTSSNTLTVSDCEVFPHQQPQDAGELPYLAPEIVNLVRSHPGYDEAPYQ
jgi:hypothetical protein